MNRSNPIAVAAYTPTPELVAQLGNRADRLADMQPGFPMLAIAQSLVDQHRGITIHQLRVTAGLVEHNQPMRAWCADCHLAPLDPDVPACPQCGMPGIVTDDHEALVYAQACDRDRWPS